MYSEGRGVPKDYTKAAEWLKTAAEQGDANSQLDLGWMYLEGQLRAGELTPIYVPDREDEAMRDLTRARNDARIAKASSVFY